MSSTAATLNAAPLKPWEQAPGLSSSIPFAPIAPYSSFPSLPPLPSSWPSAAAMESSAAVPNGYQRPSGFPYSQPYRSYGGYGAPAPGSYLMSSVEGRARPFFDSLNLMLNALNQVAAVVDSASYAVWASAAAFGALGGTLKSLRSVYWQRLVRLVSVGLAEMRRSGRRKILLIAALLGAVWAFREAFRVIQEASSILKSDPTLPDEKKTGDDLVFAKAMHPFAAVDSLHLGFEAGDVLLLSRQNSSKLDDQNGSWIMARSKEGKTGLSSALVDNCQNMGRKYRTKFPMARIKKIMQLDNEIGKVALATPILISKALELFMQDLVDKACVQINAIGSAKLEPQHLKACVFEAEQFDFLKDLFVNVQEPEAAGPDSISKDDEPEAGGSSTELKFVPYEVKDGDADRPKTPPAEAHGKLSISAMVNPVDESGEL